MSRPMINCPICHRELYHLHQPQCSWCGTDLLEEEFEKVALPPGELPPDLPPLPPPAPLTGLSQGNFGWGLLNQPQNFQLDLNVTQIALAICVILVPLAYFLWQKFQVHPLMPPVH